MDLTISVTVRDGRDPILLAKTLSINTFNFGISSHDMFIMGIAFIVIGGFLIVNPLIFLIRTYKDIKN